MAFFQIQCFAIFFAVRQLNACFHSFMRRDPLQYNWGYPAALKNALDFLYKEWHNKPAGIISYGGHGGGKAAAQLQQVSWRCLCSLDA